MIMKLKTILNQSFEDLNKLTKEQALEQSKVLVKTLERRVKSLYKTRGEGKQYIRIPSQYFYTRGKKAGQLKLKIDEGATRNKALSKLTDLIRATNNPETLSSFQIQQFNEVNERLASYGLNLSAKNPLNSFLAASLSYDSIRVLSSAIIFLVFWKYNLPLSVEYIYHAFNVNSCNAFFSLVISLLGSAK